MRVVCATDLLPKSNAAVSRARLLARQLGADLSLVHVVSTQRTKRSPRAADQALRAMNIRFGSVGWHEGRRPDMIVRAGDPARHLVRIVREIPRGILVMGPHREHPLRDVLSATLVERVLHLHHIPVLIVRTAPSGPYRNVLIALDLSPIAGEIIRTAESLILGDSSRACVIHAFELAHTGLLPHAAIGFETAAVASSIERRRAEQAVRELLTWHTQCPARYSLTLSPAFPTAAIAGSAKRVKPDLLVMGTRGHGHVVRTVLGSISNEVMRAVGRDILLVPKGSAERVPVSG